MSPLQPVCSWQSVDDWVDRAIKLCSVQTVHEMSAWRWNGSGFNPGRSASPSRWVNVPTRMRCSWTVPASSGKASFFWLVPQEMTMGTLVKDGRSGCRCIVLGSLTWYLWEMVPSFLCPYNASHPCPLYVSLSFAWHRETWSFLAASVEAAHGQGLWKEQQSIFCVLGKPCYPVCFVLWDLQFPLWQFLVAWNSVTCQSFPY